MKYKFRKALASYKTDVNVDYKEERFSHLMNTGMNTFFRAMRVNGKKLTPKNYKITAEVLKKLSNGEVIIEYITPIKKHEEEYVGTILTKARMKINFSKEIKTLGTQKEIFKKVKEILRNM